VTETTDMDNASASPEFNLAEYYSLSGRELSFNRDQASRFAKRVAGDFNPIHDVDYKRFCVPGDLLFAVILAQFGVAPHTRVSFDGMVNDSTVVTLPDSVDDTCTLLDEKGRHYLSAEYSTSPTLNPKFVARLTEQYVKFSGQTFPDILVGLMRQENAMINPKRPLVIYKEMVLELDELDGDDVALTFESASLSRSDKKGEAQLEFTLTAGGRPIGSGRKVMLLGGLRDFDQQAMDDVINEYEASRRRYG